MRAWNADDIGLTPDDYLSMAWEQDRYMLGQRWKALKALWGRPVVNEWSTKRRTDGVIVYVTRRAEEWTFWRSVRATIGIFLGLHWHDRAEQRWRSRGRGYVGGLDVAFWDSGTIYGGYTAQVCLLYPGCRVSIFDDSETFL